MPCKYVFIDLAVLQLFFLFIKSEVSLFMHGKNTFLGFVEFLQQNIYINQLIIVVANHPIIYFFDGRSPTRHKQTFFFHLAGA